MIDKKLIMSALEDIEILRSKLLVARENIDENHSNYKSLLNLRHYLILRSEDWTKLQEKLFELSLSSLGRSYAHVAGSIDTLYDQLRSSLGLSQISEEEMIKFHHLSIKDSISLASKNSQALFGGKASSKLSKQSTSIMVTLPSNAAQNNGVLIRSLVEAGVNVFRINTAHDNSKVWKEMADIITSINKDLDENEKVKIFVDLAGPKIRTGKIRQSALPVSLGSNKIEKEVMIYFGDVITKSQTTDSDTLQSSPAQICVNKDFFKKIKLEKSIEIIDINSKKASIEILELGSDYAKGVINKKVFIDEDSKLSIEKHKGKVKNIETKVEPIRLFVDDLLIISNEDILGHAAIFDDNNELINPALISCSFKNIISSIKIGQKLFIDDGKIGLKVVEKSDKSITCKVINAKAKGTLLKEEKGINLPDTNIDIPAITEMDRLNTLNVLEYVDHLSISFCQNEQDVLELQNLLKNNNRTDIGIIAKIETKQAISNMPKILEQLLAWDKSGVMIARGDLAIEVGFDKMAYTQEMLLEICDSAHIPVIWATQVLESMMKSHLPSRAEVTDAAMAGRAECVMLNKGAFAVDTIDILIHILDDMHSLFKKNKQLLKKGTLW